MFSLDEDSSNCSNSPVLLSVYKYWVFFFSSSFFLGYFGVTFHSAMI